MNNNILFYLLKFRRNEHFYCSLMLETNHCLVSIYLWVNFAIEKKAKCSQCWILFIFCSKTSGRHICPFWNIGVLGVLWAHTTHTAHTEHLVSKIEKKIYKSFKAPEFFLGYNLSRDTDTYIVYLFLFNVCPILF